MSELRTNRIVPRDGLVSGTGIGGGIIQVKSVTKTDTFTKASGGGTSFVDVTGLSVSITPKRSDSKILVIYDMQWASINGHCSCRLMRDSTPIKIGDASSNKTQVTGQIHHTTNEQYDLHTVSGTHMDSPATTSSVTYKMQVGTPYSSSYELKVNYHEEDSSDQSWAGRAASTITVMEVSG